jgi:hypothetical protein
MSRFRAAAIAALTLLVSGSLAQAQLPQPRCDGYPPRGRGLMMQSVLVGYAGRPCYGQVFENMRSGRGMRGGGGGNFSAGVAISSISVMQPAAGARQLPQIGLREFQYTPSANLRGWDRIVLRYDIERRGQPLSGRLVFRATTQEHYAAAGGTPPAAGEPDFAGGGRRGRR